MKEKISQPYQLLLFTLGVFFSYKAIDLLGGVLLNGCFLMLNAFSFYPTEGLVILNVFIQLLMNLFLVLTLVKVYRNDLTILEIFYKHQFHKKLLIGVVILYLINITLLSFHERVYEGLIEDSMNNAFPFSSIGEKLFFLNISESILNLIEKGLFVIIYILLIRKEGENGE